ncbi:MAG TPA: alpha/beta hydrolase [Solirubrobacterales bacterium]|nr:alpha/beta hydrolase [Solirubrobacterales bacterium]
MPAFLVHGNPDTSAEWDGVIDHLADYGDEVVAADLPGFAHAAPEGFPATKEAYVEWIVEHLEKLGGGVDLVGHDWGSLLVQRVASIRPDLLASVACGGAAVDVDYPWHPLAQVWQTPGEGEKYMEEELTAEFGIEHLVENGVPRAYAERNIWLTPHGKKTILDLYRSAVHIGAEWQPDLEQLDLPAMVIWGRTDPYVPLEFGEALAERMKAELVVLECGHWWPFEKPVETAEALLRHWAAGKGS